MFNVFQVLALTIEYHLTVHCQTTTKRKREKALSVTNYLKSNLLLLLLLFWWFQRFSPFSIIICFKARSRSLSLSHTHTLSLSLSPRNPFKIEIDQFLMTSLASLIHKLAVLCSSQHSFVPNISSNKFQSICFLSTKLYFYLT